MVSSTRIRLLDELVARAASSQIEPALLAAVRGEQESLSAAGRPVTLAEILVRRDLLSLRQVNRILSISDRRLILCPSCKETQVLSWKRFQGAISCSGCGMGLDGLLGELCLPETVVSTQAMEYGPSLVGRIDGNVHIRRRLTEGRYSGWYAGQMRPRKERVVLMELPPEVTETQTRLGAIRERFEMAKRLQTAARPLIFELATVSGRHFVLESPLEGPSAADLVSDSGELAPLDMLRIMAPVASAMRAAHARGMLGFDLFPEAIVLEGHTEPRLMDLATGFLRRRVAGQVAFRAPETLHGETPDERADVYGFCAVCWFLLAGAPPFDAMDLDDLEGQIQSLDAPSIAARRVDLHPQLAELLDAGMSRDPARRPATMELIAQQIEKARLHHRWLAEQRRDVVALENQPAAAPLPESRPPPSTVPASSSGHPRVKLPADDPGLREIVELERRAKDHIEHRRYTMATRALERILEYESRGPGYAERVARARWVLAKISTKRKS